MWTIPLKSDKIYRRCTPAGGAPLKQRTADAAYFIITGLPECDKGFGGFIRAFAVGGKDRNGISDRGHPRRTGPVPARQAALAGQAGHGGGAGRLRFCVGRQQGGTEAAGLAAQTPLHPAVSGRQPRKLPDAGTVPGDRTVRRQGPEPWRQPVPCVPGQHSGAGGQKVPVLRRGRKPGQRRAGAGGELVEGRDALR